ncbi:hypothetical protein ACFYN5_36405 [Streptomyces sp. NPDC007126]|uniref:hypothetical protein n=1 Tax=Streptomyces sp. NPDC007126 TaxID=3364774 RepID=UPI0036CCD64F
MSVQRGGDPVVVLLGVPSLGVRADAQQGASGPGDRESPRSHPSSQIIILTICTSVLVLLLLVL